MTAPWSIELDEDILRIIKNHILVRVGNDDGDRAFLCFWDWFRFDAGLQLAVNEALDERGNILLSQSISLEWIFLALDRLLNGK